MCSYTKNVIIQTRKHIKIQTQKTTSNTSALPLTTSTFDKPVTLIACSKKSHRLFIDSKSVTFHATWKLQYQWHHIKQSPLQGTNKKKGKQKKKEKKREANQDKQ